MATATVGDRQEYTFQAEIKQLLHLLSHSLYQSREIAVRELISNASDALDKMRYVSLTDESQREAGALEIVIEGREGDSQLVIRDTGIGMTHDELVANLGTIAHSGSAEFLKAMTAGSSSKPDVSLIGQFGVGFYSAFMIADRVRVRTRSYREEAGLGVGVGRLRQLHRHAGRGPAAARHRGDPAPQGRRQGLRLRLADPRDRPAVLQLRAVPDQAGGGGEVLNDQKPIWVEPKSQVTEEQYNSFYQHLTHHPDEKPLWHLHLAADSPIQFRAIVYCPPTNLERLGFSRLEHGLSLCAKRVLVQSECRELVPEYLRFLRGLVDSEDLPLNVSRETLQDNSVIRRIRTSISKGVLDRLDTLAEGGCRGVPHLLRPVRRDAQGGPDHGSAQPRADRQAAAVRLVARRGAVGDRLARRIHRPDARGAEADLLPRRARPRLGRQEPQPRDLPPARPGGALPHRPDRRVRHHLADHLSGQDAHLDRFGRPRPARHRRAGGRRRIGVERATGPGERIRPRAGPVPLRPGQSGQGGPRVEAADRQPVLPGQRRGRPRAPRCSAC